MFPVLVFGMIFLRMANMFKAKLYFLSEQEGGRKTTLVPKSPGEKTQYRPTTQNKGGSYWSLVVFFDAPIEPGKEYELDIAFFTNMALEYFKIGDELFCYEGSRIVAKGKIIDGRPNSAT